MTRAPGLAAAPVALAAAACLSVPPYQPPASALTYTEDAGGTTVAADGFALHFAGGSGFHFPDALTVDGINTISSAPTPCYAESGVGMVLYPTPRINAATKAVTTSQLTPTMRGPAVIQVRVDWSSQFICSDNHPFGSSLYTVFLDGRIVRHDSLDDHKPTPNTSAGDCACDPSEHQGFQLESFWTFDAKPFTSYSVPDGGTNGVLPMPADLSSSFQKTNFYVTCLDAGRYQIGVALSRSRTIVGTPKTAILPTLAVFDREHTGGFDSMFDPLLWDTNDAVFVEHGTGCKKVLERAEEHASASTLAVNGDPIPVSLVNGIYGGDPADDNRPGVKVPAGRVELAGPIGGSFAAWLRFTSNVDGVRAQLAGKTGAWYVLQRIDATNWIAWFRDPLMPGETIAIETD